MFCPKCGTQLPDDAAFCMRCGTSLKVDNLAPKSSQYETCIIVWTVTKMHLLTRSEVQFWAKATGPKGIYNAGESEVWHEWGVPSKDHEEAQAALNQLITQLYDKGWESIGRSSGDEWWSERFRRLRK